MASKDLRKAIQGLGLYITGKEAKKVAKDFGVNELTIAQLASKYASEDKSAVSFSSKLANTLSKLSNQLLAPERRWQGGTLDSFSRMAGAFSSIQTEDQLKNLKVSGEFVENLSQTPKASKGQMLTIGTKGTGSLMPKGSIKGGGGNKKGGGGKQAQPEVTQEAAYADLLGQFLGEGFDMVGGAVGGALATMSAADRANERRRNRTTDQMTALLEKSIEIANQPVQMPTINIPEPVVLSSPGDNYNISGVRAPSRTQRRRTDYLRNNMSIGGNIAPSLMSTSAGGLSV